LKALKYILIAILLLFLTGCSIRTMRETIPLNKPYESELSVESILNKTKQCYETDDVDIILETSEEYKYSKIKIYKKHFRRYDLEGVITIFSENSPVDVHVTEDLKAKLFLKDFVKNNMECKNEK